MLSKMQITFLVVSQLPQIHPSQMRIVPYQICPTQIGGGPTLTTRSRRSHLVSVIPALTGETLGITCIDTQ